MRQYRKGDRVRVIRKPKHGFSLNIGRVCELYAKIKPTMWRVHTGSGHSFVDEADIELVDANDIQNCIGFLITSPDKQWEITGEFNLDKRKLESLEGQIKDFWKYRMGEKVDVCRNLN